MTITTIGLVLLGFLVGALLVALYARSRTRRLAGELSAQIRSAQEESTSRLRLLDEQKTATQGALSQLQTAQDDVAQQNAQIAILEAQLHEAIASAGEAEDRLNASEARALTAEAVVEQHRVDLDQWGSAYYEVQNAYGGLHSEHLDLLKRQKGLEDELLERRAELDRLSTRLDALHESQGLGAESSADQAETEQSLAAVVLAHEDSRTALRRREMDLAEVQSHLNAMRYSINVLTKAGAELAQRWLEATTVEHGAQEAPARLTAHARPAALSAGGEAGEELLDLRGIIADWYAEMEPDFHFDARLLLLFGGAAPFEPSYDSDAHRRPTQLAERFQDVSSSSGSELVPTPALAGQPANATAHATAHAPELPAALQLAALKAASVTALERVRSQRLELVDRLQRSNERYTRLAQDVAAWRTMLEATLGTDAEVRDLLDSQKDAPPNEMLAACATVALAAYQRKHSILEKSRVAAESAALAGAADVPAEPSKPSSASPALRSALLRATDLTRLLRNLPSRR